MKKNQISAGILAGLLLISNPVMAVSEAELQNRKNQNEQKINQQDQTIKKYEGQVNQMTEELKQLDQEITEYNQGIEALDIQVKNMLQKIQESKREVDDLKAHIGNKQDSFEKRLQAMYMSGKTSYIEILLNCSSISDVLSKTYLIQNLVEHDTALIKTLEDHQVEIEKKKKDLDEQNKSLDNLKKELEVQEKELKAKADEKEALIKEIQENIEYAKQVRSQMKAEQEAIDAQIRAAAEAREREQAAQGINVSHIDVSAVGQMAWPLPASYNVTSEFGPRKLFNWEDIHTGLDISAPPGTPIVAAREGTVVYAGWGGYGVTVIIDHGGGLYTLYGHGTDGSIRVSNGQHVVAGDVVMGVGSTGYSTGPHLHFEVRVGGNSMSNAVNPRQFL